MLNINLEEVPRGHGLAALALLLVLGAVVVHGWPEAAPPFIDHEECEAMCGGEVVSWSPTWCSCGSKRLQAAPRAHARARLREPSSPPPALADGIGGTTSRAFFTPAITE